MFGFDDHFSQKENDRFAAFWRGYMSGAAPEPARAVTTSELAFWFSQFANACRRALPVGKEKQW